MMGPVNAPYAVQQASSDVLRLSLDDAVARGVDQNLNVKLARQNELAVHGEILTVGNALLPNLKAVGQLETQQINLAALGFTGKGLPPAYAALIHPIVKVDTALAEMKLNQALFNVPAFYLWRAAERTQNGAALTTLNARGGVVLQVATTYLRALADESQIAYAQALEKADQEVLRQANASHDAGVGTNLDVLRARVQLQTQQQVLINTENQFEKDKIALTRLIGLPADQKIELTDKAPYAEYATLPLDDAMKLAFERRKDLLNLQAQIEIANQTRKAITAERYPVVAFDGYYGVLGELHGLYHGVFTAEGTIQVPIFQEATLRGQREVADSQLTALRQQEASLKVTINQQIRSSMLDVQSANEQVKVAQSNVDLATQALQDSTDRFAAGVDDNLPVVQAQATLADAQTRLVQTLYQYNAAKLQLARNTGVVETQYKTYLGR
jgi:outer membrane protein TolC